MASSELAMRFTEEKYATKNEVAHDLKMSLIDTIWSNILSYRSNYYRYLPIRSIEKNALNVCLSPALTSTTDAVAIKLNRLAKNLSGQSAFKDVKTVSLLKSVAKSQNLEMDEGQLMNVLKGHYAPNELFLVRYLSCIEEIRNHYREEINLDFIFSLYQKLSDTSFSDGVFRTKELAKSKQVVLIDRTYYAAPVQYIESLMSTLEDFLSSNTLSPIVKALEVFYYIQYIKPFSAYNEETAVLAAKAVLCHETDNPASLVLPLEQILSENKGETDKHCADVQKTNDTTYFIRYEIKNLETMVISSLDELSSFSADEIKQEFFKEDTPAAKEPEPVKTEVRVSSNKKGSDTSFVPLFELNAVDEIAQKPLAKKEITPKPAPVPETRPAPVIQTKPETKTEAKAEVKTETKKVPEVEKKITPEPVKPEKKPIEEEKTVSAGYAFSYVPQEMDEKTASRLEKHLLELEPTMKKGEAKFYARHCTMGMMYTIQQYKKSIGCVYETARTSMEHLVEMGYYQKKQVKNKFVYTPVLRK